MGKIILKVDNLKHDHKSEEVALKQKHILQVQNIKHTLNINLIGGKLNGKIDL